MKYLLLMLLASPACAGLITVGQSNPSANGVTLSIWSGGGNVKNGQLPPTTFSKGFVLPVNSVENEIYSDEYQGVFADPTFLSNMDGRLFLNFEVFRADFTTTTDFVDIHGGGFGQGDPLWAFAYDSNGRSLGGFGCNVPMLTNNEFCDLTFTGPGIAFVTAAGSKAGQDVISMTFDQVPEPGTLGLMALALIFVATWKLSCR